jgi:hypothetical protein
MTTNDLSIGTVSHGTLRDDDLAVAFLDALESVDAGRAAELYAEYDAMGEDSEELPEFVQECFDILNEYCPPYCYFGAHEGDGADFGVWVSWDSLDDACHSGEVFKVADLADVPDDYAGEVLHVNDHGNATLYVVENRQFAEVWSIV